MLLAQSRFVRYHSTRTILVPQSEAACGRVSRWPEVSVPAVRGSALQDAGEPGRQRPDGQGSRPMHKHPVQPGGQRAKRER